MKAFTDGESVNTSSFGAASWHVTDREDAGGEKAERREEEEEEGEEAKNRRKRGERAMAGAAAVKNVFVYGSLLAPEVVMALLHRTPLSSTALVHDFHRYSVKGRVYPAVLPVIGSKVTGKVLFELTEHELAVLDEFEDGEYTKQIVEPVLRDKGSEDLNVTRPIPLQANIYVWSDPQDKDLYGDWDYELAEDDLMLYSEEHQGSIWLMASGSGEVKMWRKNCLSDFMRRYLPGTPGARPGTATVANP